MAVEGRRREGVFRMPRSISMPCKVSVAPVTTYRLLLLASILAACLATLAGATQRLLAALIPAFLAAFIANTQ